ncbi:hypothetical protein CAK95_10530 [Pseudorhodoplanes sinuspersici]|uniref:DUF3108 domain-containing protein n=2 Tax=Pseudorhodoplanes sinuspersici TaxID=1235591 RepID=A0A1W7A1K4_9HYPH|nr:hypothetical protein CAK95_10530 [Pseudorhodoplanes sinuspersici]
MAAAGQAEAQAKLDARYAVTLAGIKLGEGSWVIDVGEDQFSVAASGATSGLARIFSSGRGSGESRGTIKNDQFVPARYAISIKSGKKTEDVRLKLNDGTVKDVSIVPAAPEPPDRVPVTDAHKRNVFDPMTGSLLRISGNGNLMKPEVCRQHTPIFDGRMRYDLTLAYKRMEQVKVPGYAGPALVCAIYFAPLAGHVPSRAAIKYLIDQRDMETWLVPIGGTRVMVPIRVQVPTPLGLGVMEATSFNVMPRPTRASIKMQ